MQYLDVISVNIWNVVISLCNLLLLTWIVKKFLFKRVQKVLAQRREAIDADYAQAQTAREQAEEDRLNYAAAMAAACARMRRRSRVGALASSRRQIRARPRARV